MSNNAIEDLQVKVAFLEDALHKLSDEYYQQQRELDALKQKLAGLIDKVSSQAADSADSAEYVDEKPPHY